MHIAIITGSYPPQTCGIGDYTCHLEMALRGQGLEVQVLTRTDWSLSAIVDIVRTVKASAPDLVHIQYPTAGFGRRLTPQLLSLAIPSIVTIHEVSDAHMLRRLSLYPFSLRSKHIVFTTHFERSYALRYAPWIGPRSSVIPIGSNITTGRRYDHRRGSEIVYFGLFRPNKGAEDVLALAALIQERGLPLSVRMIGKAFPADSPYFRDLYRRSLGLPVRWERDLDDAAVADILSRAAIAYAPYPDGASGRRGSLLALLANGVATVTTRGPQTPLDLEDAVLFADAPEEALKLIGQVLADGDLRDRLSARGRDYASQFSWEAIARAHAALYQDLLAGEGRRS